MKQLRDYRVIETSRAAKHGVLGLPYYGSRRRYGHFELVFLYESGYNQNMKGGIDI